MGFIVRSVYFLQRWLILQPALLNYQADVNLRQILIDALQAALVLVGQSLQQMGYSCH